MFGVNNVNVDPRYLNLVMGHLDLQLSYHNRMQHEWYTGLISGTAVAYSGDSVCTSQPREWLH